MPGAVAPAASCAGNAQRNAHEFSAGTTEHTPASPAQWFSAYTRSPRSAGLVSLRRSQTIDCELDASVGAPGPRDFAVRLAHRSSCGRNASIAPRPTFVTIGRNAPLAGAGWAETIIFFCKTEEKYFLPEGLT